MLIHPRRTLVRALIVSLLVHAGLLLGVTRTLPARVESPAVAIKVVMNRALPVAAQQAATVPAAGRPVSGGVPATPAAPKTEAKKLAVADSPSRDRGVPASAPSAVAQDVAKASSVPAGAGAGPLEGTSPASVLPARGGSSPPPQDGVDAEDVKQYRFALGGNARRFKRYPVLARERGWEGAVEIALVFRRLHSEPAVSLAGSSGKKILDDQALEMIRQAVRQTDLPERLKGRDFRIVEEVVFSLEDE